MFLRPITSSVRTLKPLYENEINSKILYFLVFTFIYSSIDINKSIKPII